MTSETINLPTALQRTLTVLVNEHRATGQPVPSARLAEILDRHPGTVKNQMPKLTSLGLVESVRGPEGGYEPTAEAVGLLDGDGPGDAGTTGSGETESVAVAWGYERTEAAVSDVELTNVHDPEACRAHLYFRDTVEGIGVGEPIIVGPTPVAGLVIGGRVEAKTDTADGVLIEVHRLEAPFDE
jgi:predicted transcriptional regulator